MKRRCIAAFSNKCKLLRSPLIRLAVRLTPSSVWEKAFIVVRFSRNLASLHNYCHPPRLISAPNHRTRGSGQRSWTQGWQSQTEGEKRRDDWAELAPDQAAQGFPCHGGRGGSAAFQFYSSSFHVTYRFFVTFFTEESNVPLRSLRSLRPLASLLFAIKKAKLLLRRSIAIRVSLFHPEAGLAAVH